MQDLARRPRDALRAHLDGDLRPARTASAQPSRGPGTSLHAACACAPRLLVAPAVQAEHDHAKRALVEIRELLVARIAGQEIRFISDIDATHGGAVAARAPTQLPAPRPAQV